MPYLTGFPREISATVLLETSGGAQVFSIGTLSTVESSGGASGESTILGGVSATGSVGTFGFSIQDEESAVAISGVSATASWGTLSLAGTIEEADDVWSSGAIINPRRRVAWNILTDFPDTEYEGGRDFIPRVASAPGWRVSTVTRDRILIRSRESVSKDTEAEGKP
jgi:hypothetical protein